MMKTCLTTVIVNTTFEGTHQYVDAPQEVSYLRVPHRHIFHVNVEIQVFHDDRELEFIMIKHRLDEFLRNEGFSLMTSCEQYAKHIIEFLIEKYGERQICCQVLEDGENGGKVYYGN